jgi:hypothetical protein
MKERNLQRELEIARRIDSRVQPGRILGHGPDADEPEARPPVRAQGFALGDLDRGDVCREVNYSATDAEGICAYDDEFVGEEHGRLVVERGFWKRSEWLETKLESPASHNLAVTASPGLEFGWYEDDKCLVYRLDEADPWRRVGNQALSIRRSNLRWK